jgi:16S rRNA (cytosine967-C5)-methyltransferase
VRVAPARNAAFEILMRVETTDAYASELLHSSRFNRLSTTDHALVTELVMGVLRWRTILDNQIALRCSQPVAKLDREVLISLRIGTYQLMFLDRIPPHAAINESVELVKQARKKSAAGMVNAMLRKLAETRFAQKADASNFRAAHPDWLVERWKQTHGPVIADKICRYNQSVPPTAVRINSNSANVGTAVPGCPVGKFRPGHLLANAAIVVGDVVQTVAAREQRLIIQDEASQLVALLIGEGKNILDCCAAPGGKGRIIAQQNPNANIIATDLHPHRAKLIRKLVTEPNVHVVAGDARTMPFATKFDRILVDAPCSGTGTLARNPDIKWRLNPQDIDRLQRYQIEILTAAMKHTAQGGRIVYSTCSLEPEENQQVLERAIAADSSFCVVDCKDELRKLRDSGELIWNDLDSLLIGRYVRTIPGLHPCDGLFAAILQRE